MESKIDISNLSFNRATKLSNDFKKYEINVDLVEENSTDTETTLKYSLDLTSTPKNSVISITGFATFTGKQDELETYLQETQNDIPNPVINIYEEIFPLMYIITKNMHIPSPAHNIAQNNVTKSVPNSEDSIKVEDKIENDNVKQDENITNESDSELNKSTVESDKISGNNQESEQDNKETTDE